MRDYYEILGIKKDATTSQIKKAYRQKALKYHPDQNKEADAEDKFKEVSKAYEVLINTEQRRQYDQFGHNPPKQSWSSWTGHDPFDIFNEIFGRRPSHSTQGKHIQVLVEITLEDVLKGCKKEIRYKKHALCQHCQGKGGATATCKNCHGTGKNHLRKGFVQIYTTCNSCRGTGASLISACQNCQGVGKIGHEQTVTIDIPAGLKTNNQINIPREGERSDNGRPGDLICKIIVRPHRVFERVDRDLFCTQTIHVLDAILGTRINVPTLEGGFHSLTIPAGTQFGEKFQIAGRGVPIIQRSRPTPRGNLNVTIQIEIPEKLKPKERELLKRWKDLRQKTVNI